MNEVLAIEVAYHSEGQAIPLIEGRGGCTHFHAWPQSYGHRPSHPYNAGTEHVGFSQTRKILLASSAKRHEVLDKSHEG